MSSGLIREAGMQIRKQKFKKVEAGKMNSNIRCIEITNGINISNKHTVE